MTEETIYLLYLDDYHSADTLFLNSLSLALARPAPGGRLIVHGSGEHVERLLEAEGLFRKRTSGVLPVETPEEHALVERGIRQLNQKIVGILTDAVVSAVGVMGTQRRLLKIRSGRVVASECGWIRTLTGQNVVPVIAAYARDSASETSGEVPLGEAVTALADGLGNARVEVIFFTKNNQPGLGRSGDVFKAMPLDRAAEDEAIPDVNGLHTVVEAGLPVTVTNTTGLADPAGPEGTRVVAA